MYHYKYKFPGSHPIIRTVSCLTIGSLPTTVSIINNNERAIRQLYKRYPEIAVQTRARDTYKREQRHTHKDSRGVTRFRKTFLRHALMPISESCPLLRTCNNRRDRHNKKRCDAPIARIKRIYAIARSRKSESYAIKRSSAVKFLPDSAKRNNESVYAT